MGLSIVSAKLTTQRYPFSRQKLRKSTNKKRSALLSCLYERVELLKQQCNKRNVRMQSISAALQQTKKNE